VQLVIRVLMVLLGSLGFLALLLSCFLVVNTITALLTQQVRQIGIMKAVGGRTVRIVEVYLTIVLIYGLLSLTIALPAGALASYRLVIYITDRLNFDLLGFALPPFAVAVQAVVALIVPMLAALFPVLAWSRRTVREAIASQGHPQDQWGQGFVDRLLERVRGLPRPLALSLRNTFRRKGRLALTLITLTLAGAIFMSVLSVQRSLGLLLDDATSLYNFDIAASLARPSPIHSLEREAMRIPGVEDAEGWLQISGQRIRPDGTEGWAIRIVAAPLHSPYMRPVVAEGRWLRADDANGMVMSDDLLRREPDIRVGDDVVVRLGERETTWHVVGVAPFTGNETVYAAYDDLARAANAAGLANYVVLRTAATDRAALDAAAQALQDRYEQVGAPLSRVETIASAREQYERMFTTLVGFLLIMAALLGAVGALGLAGTMSLNVLDRTREIGVMRAVGATTRSVGGIVIVEGMVIGFLSWALAILLSLPLSYVLDVAIGNAFFMRTLHYSFSPGGVGLWLVIVLLISALSSLLPASRASRIAVHDALAYE
jgi:putative ABC transport system permease protein